MFGPSAAAAQLEGSKSFLKVKPTCDRLPAAFCCLLLLLLLVCQVWNGDACVAGSNTV